MSGRAFFTHSIACQSIQTDDEYRKTIWILFVVVACVLIFIVYRLSMYLVPIPIPTLRWPLLSQIIYVFCYLFTGSQMIRRAFSCVHHHYHHPSPSSAPITVSRGHRGTSTYFSMMLSLAFLVDLIHWFMANLHISEISDKYKGHSADELLWMRIIVQHTCKVDMHLIVVVVGGLDAEVVSSISFRDDFSLIDSDRCKMACELLRLVSHADMTFI